MKVLHVIESDGGTIEFIFLLAKYSPKITHEAFCGHRAYTAINNIKTSNSSEFPSNLKFSLWKSAKRELNFTQDILAAYYLYLFLKKRKDFSVIHLHSSKAGFLGRLVAKICNIKEILYTTQAVSFIRYDISPLHKKLFVFLEKIGFTLGGLVVCSSDSEKNALASQGIESIMIPNGTTLPITYSEIDNTPKTIILSIGRATIQKNPVLFNSIAQHFSNNKNLDFVWVGDGELRNSLNSSNIRITGWLDRQMVRGELEKADIYVSTATWEGMPFAVIEAMAHKKPLILSNSIGNKDLVFQNSNGFLFNDIDEAVSALNKLIDDKSLRQNMGENSYNLCKEHFNFKNIAKKYINLYSSLI